MDGYLKRPVRGLESLVLELQVVSCLIGFWDPNSGLLGEQQAPLTTEPFLQHCPTLPLLKWFSYYDKGYVQKHDDVFGCFESGLQTAQAGFKFTLWLRLTSTSNLPASTLESVLCHHIQVLGEESGALCSLDKHSSIWFTSLAPNNWVSMFGISN